MPKIYRIGTRGSLLARTQSTQIKELLESKTGKQFELKLIKTQGDLNTSAPLWQMEGKDFFTKELDEALLKEEIDLVVHSYKDLGSERPEGIHLGAITKRSFAHDILLIKKETIKTLKSKEQFIVGTSSPRRIVNIEKSLGDYIPVSNDCKIKTEMLRGNVNTRIQKLRDDNYDAIVLALAGLERLSLSNESRIELESLLEGLSFMVLPQSTFPSSASQGALGIECRSQDQEIKDLISTLQDENTVEEVSRERKAFNSYGGGCHLAVGIHVKKTDQGFTHIHKGEVDHNQVDKLYWEGENSAPIKTDSIFIGLPSDKASKYSSNKELINDQLIQKIPISNQVSSTPGHYFITSSYCLETFKNIYHSDSSIWASGNKTHQLLASEGYWVNGSADSFGEEELEILRNSNVIKILLGLNKQNNFLTLSHSDSKNNWGKLIVCYKHETLNLSESYVEKINKNQVFYWTSFTQFQKYLDHFPEIKDKKHACGLGKTLKSFQEKNIPITPYFNIDQFLKSYQ